MPNPNDAFLDRREGILFSDWDPGVVLEYLNTDREVHIFRETRFNRTEVGPIN